MKSILLIGLGRFGRHIAQELNELGHQVMAIDSNEDRVNAVLSYVTNAQIGDSTSEYFLHPIWIFTSSRMLLQRPAMTPEESCSPVRFCLLSVIC